MTVINRNVRIAIATTLLFPGLTMIVRADDASAAPDFLTEIFDAAALYENKENPYLQKLSFTGRAQFDYVHIDGDGMRPGDISNQDLHYDDFNTRRLRAGMKVAFLRDFSLSLEADFQPEEDPIYQRLTDAYISYNYSSEFGVKVGKQLAAFTLDGTTSSRELLTIDRNNLSNNLWFSYGFMPGIAVSGKIDNWIYNTGVFSQGDATGEFGEFNAGAMILTTVGYDFATCLRSEEALLTLNYVFNEPTVTGAALFTNRTLENVGSLNFRYSKDDFGFQTDISTSQGYGSQPDLWGFVVMPFYNFNESLQGVLRYTLVDSNGDNGVRYGGYESSLEVAAKGNFYQEIYLGLNDYIYGHKLKIQVGLALIDMEDAANDGGAFNGLSFQTGLRMYW